MSWDSMIYLGCLGIGFLFIVGLALLGHVFDADGGHDLDHADTGGADAHHGGISAFSPMVIAAFVAAFGGVGYVCTLIPATNKPFISAPLAAVGAIAFAATILAILRAVFGRSQGSSESKIANVVGTTATIITPISENGVGEIAYVHSGTRLTSAARSEDGKPISNGTPVVVSRVVGTQFYVRPA